MKVIVSNKEIIRLAAPISISLLIPQVNYSTNNFFLGRLGEAEMAVSGITGVYYLILISVGLGMGNGLQVKMSRHAGAEDRHGLAESFVNGIFLGLILSGLLLLISGFVSPYILGHNIHHQLTRQRSVNFLTIRMWGLPFLVFTQILNAFYIATSQTRFLVFSAIATTVVNILFDYLLIFGHWGFPALGLNGAAVASVMGEVAGVVTGVLLFLRKGFFTSFALAENLKFRVRICLDVLKLSAPLIVQFVFSIGGWLIFYFFVEHLGTRALAASNLLRTIFGIVGIGTFAFGATTNMMVSNIIAQGKEDEVGALVRRVCKLSFGFAATVASLLIIFAYQFLYFYRPEPDLVLYSIPSLRVIAAAMLLMSVSTIFFNAVVGTGKTVINLLMEICSVMIYITYCYLFIERWKMPLEVAWGSEFIYWSGLITFSSLYLKSGRWKTKKKLL